MGFRYTNWIFENASNLKLSSGALLVLHSLADQMDEHGVCWPSQAHTAARVGLNVKQVRRHVQILKEKSLISVIKNSRGGKPGQTPTYRASFNTHPLSHKQRTPMEGSRSKPLDVSKDSRSSPSRPPPMSLDDSHRREPNHHRTTKEPSVNQRGLSKPYEIPSNLRDWTSNDYAAAASQLGIRIREHDKIESEAQFHERIRQAWSGQRQK